MKILIVGENLNAFLLAKYIKSNYSSSDIFITTEKMGEDYYSSVGIKENDVQSICDFVKYNQIDFTIVTSPLAIINSIADLFAKEGFPIVAPFSEAARVTFFNSIAKKVMYKLKVNTSRFGIFDRENIAIDYLHRTKFPVAILNDFTLNQRNYDIYKTFNKAREALKTIFESENEKIVIENYIESVPLFAYFLTDGYNAIPLINLERIENGTYTEVNAPSSKISVKVINNVLKMTVFPLLDDIAKYAGSYSGILGVKFKIVNNNIYILDFYNNFMSYDLQAFLSLLDENFVKLFNRAANKNLNNINYVNLKDEYSYTIILNKEDVREEYENYDYDDFFVSEDDKKIIYTNRAATLNYAKKNLIEALSDIVKEERYTEIKKQTQKELRI